MHDAYNIKKACHSNIVFKQWVINYYCKFTQGKFHQFKNPYIIVDDFRIWGYFQMRMGLYREGFH